MKVATNANKQGMKVANKPTRARQGENKNKVVATDASTKAVNGVKGEVSDILKEAMENNAEEMAAYEAALQAEMAVGFAGLGNKVDGAKDEIMGEVQSAQTNIIQKIDEETEVTEVLKEKVDSLQKDKAALVKKGREYKEQCDEAMRILCRMMDHYGAAKSSGYTSDAMEMFTKAMDIELGAAKELLGPKAKKTGGIKGAISGISGAAGALSRKMAK